MEDLSVPVFLKGSATPLVRYEAACKAIAEAKAVDEVQTIRAQAEAVRAYARQAKNRQMEVDAAEIRIRAERRLGELMEAQGATVGKARGNQHTARVGKKPEQPATLAEAGIDKNLAHRARTYAAVPKEQFETLLKKKRQRENRRVALDPEFQAEAEAAARDLEIERDERIAQSGAAAIHDENQKLQKQVSLLTRRVASLLEENNSLKYREKMWRERAIEAGWKERAHA